MANLNRDFRDLFAALNAEKADYLLVGGYAVGFHAEPRFTKDLDVWVHATSDNAPMVFAALVRFGAPLGGVTVTDFADPGVVFQMGVPPNRIDILTSLAEVDFAEAWAQRSSARYGDQPVPVIGRAHLIRNKRAVARPQDLLDAERLERGASGPVLR